MKLIQVGGHTAKTKNKIKYAMVDDEDFDRISMYNWSLSQNGYAQRTTNYKVFRMHNDVLNPKDGKMCDHINLDKLDNRKENLRSCDRSQNQWNKPKLKNNKSGFKGVRYDKVNDKWIAEICYYNKSKFIGRFARKIDAALAYDNLASELFGDFALLNMPTLHTKQEVV